MRNRHITHLITRYVHDQLGPANRALVINHVRTCAECRAELARAERLVADLRHEMPLIGQPSAAQLTQVWAGVWGELQMPRRRSTNSIWLPGISLALVGLLVLVVVLPLLLYGGLRAEAAPMQPSLNNVLAAASPTAGVFRSATRDAGSARLFELATPQATVAQVPLMAGVGASPVPVPQATGSPEAFSR